MKFTAAALLGFIGLINAQSTMKNTALSCDISAVSCQSTQSSDSCCSPKYGLVVLTLQWIPGYGPSDAFTIHGLWPDSCNGKYAPSSGCDSSRTSSEIASVIKGMNQTLYDTMSVYWPSYTGDNNVFWSHEWSKHGTCVSTLNPKCYGDSYVENEDVLDYFEEVVALRDQWDFYAPLESSGITPGDYYDVDDISNAIQSAFGGVPKLDCTKGTIKEVSLNFYVKGRNNYIITDVSNTGTCKGSVHYPEK